MAKVLAESEFEIVARFLGSNFGRFLIGATPESISRAQQSQSDEFWRLVKRHVEPHMTGDFNLQQITKQHYKCGHCGFAWTETSNIYNGGCCEADEANNPDHTP